MRPTFSSALGSPIDTTHFGSHAITLPSQGYEQLFINLPGFGKNVPWAQAMWRLVNEAATQLDRGNLQSLEEILNLFSENYQQYCDGKGGWRHPNHPRVFSLISGPGTSGKSILRRAAYADRARELVEQQGLIDAKGVYLPAGTKIYFFEEDGIRLTGIGLTTSNQLGWLYVSAPKTLKYILPKIATMYENILTYKGKVTQRNMDQVVREVARIHWWMIQGLPFSGGTAGITDMLIKTIFKHLGIETSKWRRGIAPDMEALTTPLEQFIQNYPSFFERPLHIA